MIRFAAWDGVLTSSDGTLDSPILEPDLESLNPEIFLRRRRGATEITRTVGEAVSFLYKGGSQYLVGRDRRARRGQVAGMRIAEATSIFYESKLRRREVFHY